MIPVLDDVEFRTDDLKSMIDLMARHEEFKFPLSGVNSDGEKYLVSINKDNITIQTFQHNDWVRENIYYADGTVEELYSK